MRILITLGLICFLFVGLFGQNIENLVVKLPRKDMNVDSILLVIRQQQNIVFSYGNNLNLKAKIRFEKTELSLIEILKIFTVQTEWNYKIQKNKVLLFPPAKKRSIYGAIKDIDNERPIMVVFVRKIVLTI